MKTLKTNGFLLGLLAVCSLTSGCQVLAYTGPNGERFSRSSFCSARSVSSLVVEAGSNGVRRVDWLIYPEARITDMLYLVSRDSQLAGGSGRRRFIAGMRTAVIRRCVSPGSMKRWSAGVQIDLAALFA